MNYYRLLTFLNFAGNNRFIVRRVHGGDFDGLKFELLAQVLYGDIKVFLFLIVTLRNMCWNALTSSGQTTSKYFYAGDTVGPGKPILLSFNHYNYNQILQRFKCLLCSLRFVWH